MRDRLMGGVVAGRSHHAASRPRAGATEVETLDRTLVRGRTGDGAEVERLLGDELALKNVAACKAEAGFNIGGGPTLGR